jgi:hypothetical protein
MSVQWVLMQNNGRPSGRLSPVGVEHIFRDPDIDLPVELLVNTDHPDPRARHWSISWTVGQSSGGHRVQRVLHIVQEVGLNHYTNWGPKTRMFEAVVSNPILIASMSKAQRLALEKISESTGVFFPNGQWNCQDWVAEVLRQAVEQGLLTTEQRDRVLAAAE